MDKNPYPVSSLLYWEENYKKSLQPCEWLQKPEQLEAYIKLHVSPRAEILITGVGTSRLPMFLYSSGYHCITSIDWSSVLIDFINASIGTSPAYESSPMDFFCMDCSELEFPSEIFDCVIDKACLDSMMAANTEQDLVRSVSYLFEVQRVLKQGGLFVLVSSIELDRLVKLVSQEGGLEWSEIRKFELSCKEGVVTSVDCHGKSVSLLLLFK